MPANTGRIGAPQTARSPLRLASHPAAGAQFGLLLLVFSGIWLVHLLQTSLSPPADNIEQLNWVHALAWGYYKHPPLPTWLFWLPVRLFGASAATSYAMALACNLASLVLLWRLLLRLRGPHFANLALMGVMCVSYYNARLLTYNHNTVLMLVSAAAAWTCWKAVDSGLQRWWAALGLVLGLGLLAKYQIAVTMVSTFVFWLARQGWRAARQRRGLLLASLIALLLFTPHLFWLRSHDFGPVGYALESSLGAHLGPLERVGDAANWLADQLLNRALAAWLLLGLLAWRHRREATTRGCPRPAGAGPVPHDAGHALLLSWGLVPLLFMPLVGLLAGSQLHLPWGTPFLLFAIPAAMELSATRMCWAAVPLRAAAATFACLQALLLGASYLTSSSGPPGWHDGHWRGFDSALLVRQLDLPLRAATGGAPVCVVSGPGALAGAVALRLPEHPLVLIDGRLDRSPWVERAAPGGCAELQLQLDGVLPGGTLLGPDFPGLQWRVRTPNPAMGATPAEAAPLPGLRGEDAKPPGRS